MKIKNNKMIEEKSWEKFQGTGLLLLVNQILHAFGWCIIIVREADNSISNVYPARVKFRGFIEITQNEAYKKISKYLKDNAKNLYKEIQ